MSMMSVIDDIGWPRINNGSHLASSVNRFRSSSQSISAPSAASSARRGRFRAIQITGEPFWTAF
jgi:hypothetical protein